MKRNKNHFVNQIWRVKRYKESVLRLAQILNIINYAFINLIFKIRGHFKYQKLISTLNSFTVHVYDIFDVCRVKMCLHYTLVLWIIIKAESNQVKKIYGMKKGLAKDLHSFAAFVSIIHRENVTFLFVFNLKNFLRVRCLLKKKKEYNLISVSNLDDVHVYSCM